MFILECGCQQHCHLAPCDLGWMASFLGGLRLHHHDVVMSTTYVNRQGALEPDPLSSSPFSPLPVV